LQRNDLPNGLCGIKFAFQKPCLKMNFKYYFLKAFFLIPKEYFKTLILFFNMQVKCFSSNLEGFI
jgi:hypothetical protein